MSGLDAPSLGARLCHLTRRKRNHLWYPNVPFVFRHVSTHHEWAQALDRFRELWDTLAEKRKTMLAKKRIPWGDVDKTYKKSPPY